MTIYGFHKLTSTLKSMEGISSDERYFEGLLTVQMKDKQGEVTIVDELYKVLPVWIDRGAPISDTHSNRIVGKGINYSRTTVKNGEGHELPAIKITGKIFKNYELDNVIWNKIKNNEYKGLSFGGATRSARSPIKMKDGSTAYALSDLEHYEVAVCADPAVPMAIITDFNQIAKANFNSSVRDDGKMVIQCDKMGCYVNKIGGGGIGGGDLLTVMEGDKPENYNAVENGKKRGRPIDKTEPTGLTDKQRKLLKEIEAGDNEDSDNQYYNKFMEKKEMLDATLGNKEEKRPTQSKRDMRETETSGYTPDLEKAIEIINKAGYRVDTEDRNNGTEINDTKREIPEKKLPIKGSLSQELPTQIQQADLNESQTFEQKVQALMAEGKSRESAEKIVGSFVHKVEASSGSGGAGIGDSNNSNGGTLTTQTGGANNPIHNSKCQCDKCRSKGLDISNTGSGGTTEGAFNQNPPNAQRLNNKSDDINKDSLIKIEDEKDENTKVEVLDEWKHEKHPDTKEKADDDVDLDKIIEEETENIKGKKGGGGHRSLATRLTSGQNAKKKADDEEDEEVVEAPEVEEEERPEWAWLMNHKSNAIREVNKVHALLKLNKVKEQLGSEGKKPRSRNTSDRDDTNDPPTPKIRYSRGGDSAARQLKMSLDELIKKLPKSFNENDDQDDTGNDRGTKWQSPDEFPLDENDYTDVHGLTQRGNSRLGNTNEVMGDSVVQNTSSHGDVQSSVGRKIRDRGHGDKSGMQATMSRRNAEILRSNIEKALDELKKLMPKNPKDYTEDEETLVGLTSEMENTNQTQAHINDNNWANLQDRLTSHDYTHTGKEIKPVIIDDGGDKYVAPPDRTSRQPSKKKLNKALAELKKLSTFKEPPPKSRKRVTTESIIAENKKEREDAEKRVRAQKINVLEKSLDEIKKLQISGGLGSRGLGSEHGYTQGQQESTQVTLVQPRPEDDRVQSKRTTQEPKVVKKIRANRGVGAFGSDLPDVDKTPDGVADENTRYFDHNGNPHKTQAEADAVPARKRMNRRLARDRRNAYRADTRQTIGDRLKE